MNKIIAIAVLCYFTGVASLSIIHSQRNNILDNFIFNDVEEKTDPDEDLTTPEIIRRHGYPAESHDVHTEDGYILTLHRIPCGKGCNPDEEKERQPVLLQHGLLGSSADWIIPGPEKALAYILSNTGYDVWFGNARGNTYSRKHSNMSSSDAEFWDFTWHEMGYYDIPAVIDYINDFKQTNKSLIYIGHSMGTTMAFVMLSTRPEYNDKLQVVVTLAPVAFMNHVKSPIRLLAPFSRNIEFIFKLLGANEFLPQSKILKLLAKYGCEITQTEKIICENSMFILCGFDKDQFNKTLLPIIFGHTPAGTSTKTVLHYSQEIHAGEFQQYDYGTIENRKRYNNDNPPLYDLSNISAPVGLFYSDNDWLAGPKDVVKLQSKLRNPVISYRVPLPKFNHIDFIWGRDAPTLLFDKIIKLIKPYY